MFNFLTKLFFLWKRPKIVVVTGSGRACAAEAIFKVLNQHFSGSAEAFSVGGKTEKIQSLGLFDIFIKGRGQILIFETDSILTKNLKFFLKKSRLPILVVSQVGDIPPDKLFFAGDLEKVKEIIKLAEVLPARGHLILNLDDETVRDIKNRSRAHPLTFGLQERADLKASDIHITKSLPIGRWGTNFKLNYEGNIVPIWLENLFGKEQIYSALAAAAVGQILDINLVEISQALKFYQSLPGQGRLIGGIKNSWIFDDSESASVFSMAEAIEILGKIETEGRKIYPERGRKIAVLGDVVGVGQYTIEAHESIGERVSKAADLLFTVGPRAKFIGEGAFNKGMLKEKIFQFDEIPPAAKALQDEIKEGDLVLVDGSKEMKMEEVVKEIKAIK